MEEQALKVLDPVIKMVIHCVSYQGDTVQIKHYFIPKII